MRELLTYLQDVDLSRVSAQVGQLIANADPWILGILVSALVGIGHKMAVGNRLVYGWGLRLGALAGLAYGGIAIIQAGGLEQVALGSVIARSVILGGGVLAFIWILLPIIMFVYGNFRFGLVGFLGYCVFAVVTAPAITAEAMPGIVLRGALVAGLAMVLAWILRPIWEFVASIWAIPARATAAILPGGTKDPASDAQLSKRDRHLLRLAWLWLQKAETPAQQLPAPAQATQPLAQLPPPVDHESRRRRDKARLDAELAYLMALPQLAANFPRDMFDGWVMRYLNHHLPAEEVEENSWQLQKAMRQYHQQVEGNSAAINLEELHLWYLDEQRRINAQYQDPIRQEKLLALQDLYVSLSQRFLADPPAAIVQMIARPIKDDAPKLLPEAVRSATN